MQVEETNNNDINVYRGDYYETHDVEYVEMDNLDQDNELEGITLRRVAAYALTQIHKQLGHELYSLIEQKLTQMFQSSHQQDQEAAIMVLGILLDEEDFPPQVASNVQHYVQFLLPKIKSNIAYMRSTAIWTLSKFTSYILGSNELNEYLMLVVEKMGEKKQLV